MSLRELIVVMLDRSEMSRDLVVEAEAESRLESNASEPEPLTFA